MKTFKNFAAQGDVYFRRVADGIPAGATRVEPVNGYLIVTHSETGHNHVMEATRGNVEMYNLPDDIMNCLLVVKEPTALEHLRSHDTHEPIMFDAGTYQVRRQREYTPEGWKRVED